MGEFLELIADLPHEYWGEGEFLLDLLGKWELSVLAVRGSELVGVLVASRKERDVYVHKLAVHSAYRRQGIGRRLIRTVASRGMTKGLRSVALSSYVENVGASKFYEKLGFQTVSRRQDKDGRDLLVLAASCDVVARRCAEVEQDR